MDSTSVAICKARRVLPAPPGPVKVNKRTDGCCRREQSVPISFSRPMRGVRGVGRYCSVNMGEGQIRRTPSSSSEEKGSVFLSLIKSSPFTDAQYELLSRFFINIYSPLLKNK